MLGQTCLYGFALIANGVNLFLQVFFAIMFSDLEVDYINPIDLCNRLNPWILPEAAVQLFLTLTFLLTGHWLSFLLNVPIFAFNVYSIYTNQYLLDATEIFRTLSSHKRTAFSKFAFHLLMLFFYLYSFIVSIVEWSENL